MKKIAFLTFALALVCVLVTVVATAETTPAADETAPIADTPTTDELPLDLLAPEAVEMTGGRCQGPPKPNCVCPLVFDPVCGCNGVTYSNSCFAQCDGVRSWTEGACGSTS